MSRYNHLPLKRLTDEHREFLDAWEIPSKAEHIPAYGDLAAVHVWAGRFVLGETVALINQAHKPIGPDNGNLSVGIVREDDVLAAELVGLSRYEAMTELATQPALGLRKAIQLLMQMKGFPDQHKPFQLHVLDSPTLRVGPQIGRHY